MNDSHKQIPLGKGRRKNKRANSYHITLTKLLTVHALHFHAFGEKEMS